MPTHAEQRHLPYSQKQLFELVAAVERYPEFLPWCTAARITKRSGNVFHADLVVRFKVFQERFVSKVTLHPHALIDVEYINGPFRYLNNHWRFIEADDGGCTIDFYVDFEFRSKVLQKLIGLLFNEAVSRMVGRVRSARQPALWRARAAAGRRGGACPARGIKRLRAPPARPVRAEDRDRAPRAGSARRRPRA